MIARELRLALRSRTPWVAAAVVALLVGHGFVLAVDIYTAASRSALASATMRQQLDPLAGIVRPTLGGFDVAVALLGPLVAARGLAIEKERRSFGALCLTQGSPIRVVAAKALAALVAMLPLVAVPAALLAAFAACGGHLDAIETGVALAGTLARIGLVVAVSIAAAAGARSFAQAATVAMLVSLSSWAIDAGEGFAALAWLGSARAWSIDATLEPFANAIVSVGSMAWLAIAIGGALLVAFALARFDVSVRGRLLAAALVVAIAGPSLRGASTVRRAYDWTEARRASLPPAVVRGLRAINAPIAIDVFFDRDDSRRKQLEDDVLAKLVLARSDIAVRAPLDGAPVREGVRDEAYGRTIIHVGDRVRETRSTSRKEITTLVFEAADEVLPDYSQPAYPGYPVVIEGGARRILGALSYVVFPIAMLAIGLRLTRGRSGR